MFSEGDVPFMGLFWKADLFNYSVRVGRVHCWFTTSHARTLEPRKEQPPPAPEACWDSDASPGLQRHCRIGREPGDRGHFPPFEQQVPGISGGISSRKTFFFLFHFSTKELVGNVDSLGKLRNSLVPRVYPWASAILSLVSVSLCPDGWVWSLLCPSVLMGICPVWWWSLPISKPTVSPPLSWSFPSVSSHLSGRSTLFTVHPCSPPLCFSFSLTSLSLLLLYCYLLKFTHILSIFVPFFALLLPLTFLPSLLLLLPLSSFLSLFPIPLWMLCCWLQSIPVNKHL